MCKLNLLIKVDIFFSFSKYLLPSSVYMLGTWCIEMELEIRSLFLSKWQIALQKQHVYVWNSLNNI